MAPVGQNFPPKSELGNKTIVKSETWHLHMNSSQNDDAICVNLKIYILGPIGGSHGYLGVFLLSSDFGLISDP